MSERDPLVKKDRTDSFYFLNVKRTPSGVTRDGDYSARHSGLGEGEASMEYERAAEFMQQEQLRSDVSRPQSRDNSGGFFGFLGKLFRRDASNDARRNVSKPRKVPIKVEPKVFFANERTFLAWLHMAVTLATVALAITAFAEENDWGVMYGLALMPVSMAFCVYALWLYLKRSGMIRRKDPGPYDDPWGPAVLASLLGISIVVNFGMKLYEINI